MKYYWTTVYNSGEFAFWKEEDENALLKEAKKKYGDAPFDYGETTGRAYSAWRRRDAAVEKAV